MSGTTAPAIIEYSVDLNEQEQPEPIPVGEYPAEVVAAINKVSQTSGNVYCDISFRIHPDAYPADYTEGDPDGTTLHYMRLVLEDKPQSRYRVKKFLQSIGAKVGRSFDPNDLVGLTATVHVDHREFEGEKQANISKVVGNG